MWCCLWVEHEEISWRSGTARSSWLSPLSMEMPPQKAPAASSRISCNRSDSRTHHLACCICVLVSNAWRPNLPICASVWRIYILWHTPQKEKNDMWGRWLTLRHKWCTQICRWARVQHTCNNLTNVQHTFSVALTQLQGTALETQLRGESPPHFSGSSHHLPTCFTS